MTNTENAYAVKFEYMAAKPLKDNTLKPKIGIVDMDITCNNPNDMYLESDKLKAFCKQAIENDLKIKKHGKIFKIMILAINPI